MRRAMRWAIAAAALAAAGCGRKSVHEGPETHLHLVALLSRPTALTGSALARRMSERWGLQVQSVGERSERGTREFVLEGDAHRVRVLVQPKPLPPDLTRLVDEGAPTLAPADRAALKRHRAVVQVDYIGGSAPPVEQAGFAARAILTVAELPGFVGYVDPTAMLYRPASVLADFREQRSLSREELYLLLVEVHSVEEEDGGLWMHTHGMEQFGAPDVEARFTDKRRWQYYWELLANAALYMMERGPVLKPGHTAELAGDGVIYEARAAKADPEHPTGAKGRIELARRGGG